MNGQHSLPGPFHGALVIAALAAAGVGFTALQLGKGAMSMESTHWIMLLVILVVGYVLGRVWATPAQMVGLP
jgi:endonuclease/exonuclease/phosphatase (EEP) superfamily protein YafD